MWDRQTKCVLSIDLVKIDVKQLRRQKRVREKNKEESTMTSSSQRWHKQFSLTHGLMLRLKTQNKLRKSQRKTNKIENRMNTDRILSINAKYKNTDLFLLEPQRKTQVKISSNFFGSNGNKTLCFTILFSIYFFSLLLLSEIILA